MGSFTTCLVSVTMHWNVFYTQVKESLLLQRDSLEPWRAKFTSMTTVSKKCSSIN